MISKRTPEEQLLWEALDDLLDAWDVEIRTDPMFDGLQYALQSKGLVLKLEE